MTNPGLFAKAIAAVIAVVGYRAAMRAGLDLTEHQDLIAWGVETAAQAAISAFAVWRLPNVAWALPWRRRPRRGR